MMLAANALSDPAKQTLLTVDEEAGMGGARGLAPGILQGRLMLNLDTEDWGEFYLGCAGGLDVNVERSGVAEPVGRTNLFGRQDVARQSRRRLIS